MIVALFILFQFAPFAFLALAWDAPVHAGDCECAWCEDDRRRAA